MKPKKKYKKEFLQKFLTTSKNSEVNSIKMNKNNNIIPINNLSLETEQIPIYVNKRINTDDLLAIREKTLQTQKNKKKDFTQKEKDRLKQIQLKNKNNSIHNKSKSNRIFLPLTTKVNKSKFIIKQSFQSAQVFLFI
jgi:hypothetical protein